MSRRGFTAALAILFALLVSGCASMRGEPLPRVTIVTEFGEITAELYPEKAPVTVANFLRYAEAGHFTNGTFFRTVRPTTSRMIPFASPSFRRASIPRAIVNGSLPFRSSART